MRFDTFGLGTYKQTEPDECAETVASAVDLGYRHVDTAQGYDNEEYVGEGIERASVDREELFVATKLSTDNLGYDDALRTARESRDRLGVDAIDLLYVHWPLNTYDPEETLPALDELVDEGTVRRVGLSNFEPDQLDEALELLDAPLFAHQVECHPLLPQEELREYAVDDGHRLVAYSPIARNRVADVPEIRAVAEKHGATPAQVSLAWLLSKEGVCPIPKATGDHVRENWEAREIELDEADAEKIDDIEETERVVDFDDAPWNR